MRAPKPSAVERGLNSLTNWSTRATRYIFDFRYLLMMFVILAVVLAGAYLNYVRNWTGKDTIQVCTGFLILLTLYFAALNYEFSASKAQKDYQAARHLLTFNTACEWHKSPVKDYQKVSIGFENLFIERGPIRTVDDFISFINEPKNLDFRESLKGILNYFESSSIAAKKGLADPEFVKEFFFSIYKAYYRDYVFYIERQRNVKNNDKIWSNFTSLAEEWHPTIKDEVQKGVLQSIIIT